VAKNNPPNLDYVRPEPPSWPDAPDWVPLLIREQVLLFSMNYRARPAAVRLARRLASDPRMNKVWVELDKETRSQPRTYFYAYAHAEVHPRYNPAEFKELRAFMKWRGVSPRELPKLGPSDSESLQKWATWRFFREAFHLAHDRKPKKRVYTELRRDLAAYQKLAPHLQESAKLLSKYNHSEAENIRRLAEDFEGASPSWSPGMITNDKGDWKARSYVGALAHEARILFGKVFPRTIATTASVALGKNLNGDQVKSIIVASRKTRVDFSR
jgi:hypothetical protein